MASPEVGVVETGSVQAPSAREVSHRLDGWPSTVCSFERWMSSGTHNAPSGDATGLTHLDLTVPAPSLSLMLGPLRPFVIVVNAAFSFAAPCFSIHRLAKKPMMIAVVVDSERVLRCRL